jgi:hypothetical protein
MRHDQVERGTDSRRESNYRNGLRSEMGVTLDRYFNTEAGNFLLKLAKKCCISGCCIFCLALNCFFVYLMIWGATRMQCDEPSYTCYYVRGDYPDLCVVFIPLLDRNITCPCPPNAGYGSFECYVPTEETKDCYTLHCSESDSKYDKAQSIFLAGLFLFVLGLLTQCIVSAIMICEHAENELNWCPSFLVD